MIPVDDYAKEVSIFASEIIHRVCFFKCIFLKFYKIFVIVQSKSDGKIAYYLQKPCTCG